MVSRKGEEAIFPLLGRTVLTPCRGNSGDPGRAVGGQAVTDTFLAPPQPASWLGRSVGQGEWGEAPSPGPPCTE